MMASSPSASARLIDQIRDLPGDARARRYWRGRAETAARRLSTNDGFVGSLLAMVRADALPGPCSIAGQEGGFTSRDAAFANAALMARDSTAPVAAIVAVVAALMEESDAGDSHAPAAIAAGLETLDRLERAAGEGVRARGHVADGILGTSAATVAAGRAIGLSAPAMVDALGIAGSLASGSGEWSGADADLLAGWMARSAILAARLAQSGFSGPAEVFEGRKGLFNAYAGPGGYTLAPLLADAPPPS